MAQGEQNVPISNQQQQPQQQPSQQHAQGEQQGEQNVSVSNQQQQPQPRQQSALSTTDFWRPLTNLRRQIDTLFEDFDRMMPFRPFGRSFFPIEPFGRDLFSIEPFSRNAAEITNIPVVDVIDQDQAILISAELPGMDEKNIELKLANNTLTLRGEKKDEREENRRGYYLSERSYGSFQRSFALPESIDADKIEANFDKGILTITLPKKPEAQRQEKMIDIKKQQTIH